MPKTLPPSSTTVEEIPKTKKLSRLQAQKWFFTFPQCPLPREEAVENLLANFPPLEWYVISSEKHKDGNPHLHMALCFKETFSSRDMRVFDKICGQHGNYQPMRNIRQCVAYVTKDKDWIAHGIDPAALAAHRASKANDMAKMLMEGKTVSDLNLIDPGYVMQNKRKLEEYSSWIERRKEKEKKKEWVKFLTKDIEDLDTAEDMSIAAWLNLNVKEPREFKQRQLYIHGPQNMGKSSLIRRLDEYLNIYYVPRDDGEFCDEYEDGVYDLIVLDEFTHKKTMQWMNQLLDGQVCYLKKKGGQILKRDNLPVIVLSNYSLEKNYSGLADKGLLGPLLARFLVVEVKEFISVFPSDE